MPGCPVVGRVGDIGLEDRADSTGARGRVEVLDVLGVGADIADMREGEGDDLAGIGGIGKDLLVAGERGVEAHFRDRRSGGAEAAALDHRAVGKHQKGGRLLSGPGGGGRGHGGTPVRRCKRSAGPFAQQSAKRDFPASARHFFMLMSLSQNRYALLGDMTSLSHAGPST